MFRSEQDSEHDPARRLAAAHELGHWIGFRAAGITCSLPRVKGHGWTARGYVVTGRVECRTPTEMRAYLVAILAGRAAGQLWSELPNETGRQTEHHCEVDEAQARAAMRHHLARGMTRTELYRDAQTLIRRHWSRITHHVPEIARTGRLASKPTAA